MNNTAKLAALQALYAQLPTIQCQQKCHDYCGPVPMTRLEARRIPEMTFDTMKLGHSIGSIPGRGFICRVTNDLKCSALKDGKCSVYERRPAICRLWGLTDELRCPFGCEPSVRWTEQQAYEWLRQVAVIGL